VGVKGTPTIFINGSITKARTLEDFQAIVVRELEKSGKITSSSERQ
jgi:protein-disulfide isomerase